MKKILLMVLAGMLCLQVSAWAKQELPDKKIQLADTTFTLDYAHSAASGGISIINTYRCEHYKTGCSELGGIDHEVKLEYRIAHWNVTWEERMRIAVGVFEEEGYKEIDSEVIGQDLYWWGKEDVDKYGNGHLKFLHYSPGVTREWHFAFKAAELAKLLQSTKLNDIVNEFMRWKEPEAVKLDGWNVPDGPIGDDFVDEPKSGGSDGSSAKPEAPSSGGDSQSIHAVGWVNPKTGKRRSVTF